MRDRLNLTSLTPGLSIRLRHLPDSVVCVIACPEQGSKPLILLDQEKPLALQHLAQLLAETALVKTPDLQDLPGLPPRLLP